MNLSSFNTQKAFSFKEDYLTVQFINHSKQKMRIGVKSYLIKNDHLKQNIHQTFFQIVKKDVGQKITTDNFREMYGLIEGEAAEVLKLLPNKNLALFSNCILSLKQEIDGQLLELIIKEFEFYDFDNEGYVSQDTAFRILL